MHRKKIAAGNWKMNTSLETGLQLTREIANADRDTNTTTIIAAPYTHLKTLRDMSIHVKNLHIAAQNCHHEKSGAYTGEISVEMLSHMNITHCIVGHSERRAYFNESHEQIATKIDLLLEAGLEVIFCCGEPLDIREANSHVAHVSQQIKDSLFHLSDEQLEHVVIAYEPIWAIGTGVTASSDQAQDMHNEIRKMISDKYDTKVADGISILYGGSVKPGNAKELFGQKDIDGGLVGGASLKSEDFIQIINSFN